MNVYKKWEKLAEEKVVQFRSKSKLYQNTVNFEHASFSIMKRKKILLEYCSFRQCDKFCQTFKIYRNNLGPAKKRLYHSYFNILAKYPNLRFSFDQ